MEAHGSPVAKALQTVTGLLPDALAAPLNKVAGVDRLAALRWPSRVSGVSQVTACIRGSVSFWASQLDGSLHWDGQTVPTLQGSGSSRFGNLMLVLPSLVSRRRLSEWQKSAKEGAQ